MEWKFQKEAKSASRDYQIQCDDVVLLTRLTDSAPLRLLLFSPYSHKNYVKMARTAGVKKLVKEDEDISEQVRSDKH